MNFLEVDNEVRADRSIPFVIRSIFIFRYTNILCGYKHLMNYLIVGEHHDYFIALSIIDARSW